MKLSRWIVSCFALLLVSQAAWARVDVRHRPDGSVTYDFLLAGIDLREVILFDQPFTSVHLKGVEGFEGVMYRKGRPGIPVIRLYVEGDGEIRFVRNSSHRKLAPMDRPLLPVQESRPKTDERTAIADFVQHSEAYLSNRFLPAKAYAVKEAGSIRGVRRRLVTIYPYQYLAVTGEQRYLPMFSLHVGPSEARRQRPEHRPDEMVFLVGAAFKGMPALQDYAAFKEQSSGLKVSIVDVAPEDTPVSIRAMLRQRWQASHGALRHVLIVGDHEDIPAAPAQFLQDSRHVTDHPYRSLDTEDYEQDVNGPDVSIGRIATSNADELEVILAKYRRYQEGRFAQTDWLARASFLATDDPYFFQMTEANHDFVIEQYFTPAGFYGEFPEEGAGADRFYPVTFQANTRDIHAALSSGRGLVHFSGHGFADRWQSPPLYRAQVRALTNEHSLPFVVAHACSTGQFVRDESIAETWQRQGNGAIMYWGSMDLTYWREDEVLQKSLYREIFAKQQLQFGAMMQASLAEVWRYYGGEGFSAHYWETYVPFGDPSVRLRTAAPREVDVSFEKRDERLAVRVIDAQTFLPVAGARVSARETHDGALVSGETDQTGTLTLPLTSFDWLAVSGDNLVLWRAP